MGFPEFRIAAVQDPESSLTVGELSSLVHGESRWVGEGWLGFLMDEGIIVAGRWRLLNRTWAFEPETPQSVDIVRSRPTWAALDGYWGQRAEIVLDQGREWRLRTFEPTAGVKRHDPKGYWVMQRAETTTQTGEVVPGGWNHEHCDVCWESICAGGEAQAYFSEPNTWVCKRCYVEYVTPRSLDFIGRT